MSTRLNPAERSVPVPFRASLRLSPPVKLRDGRTPAPPNAGAATNSLGTSHRNVTGRRHSQRRMGVPRAPATSLILPKATLVPRDPETDLTYPSRSRHPDQLGRRRRGRTGTAIASQLGVVCAAVGLGLLTDQQPVPPLVRQPVSSQ